MIILPVPPPPDSILYSGFSCGQSRRLHPHPALRATFPRLGEGLCSGTFSGSRKYAHIKKGLLHQMPCSSPLYRYKENLSDSP